MLTKNQYKFLCKLIKISNEHFNSRITVRYDSKICNLSFDKIENILKIFADKKLIKADFSNFSAEVRVTYLGFEYPEFRHEENMRYIKKLLISKTSDIIVSMLTAIITYFFMPYIQGIIAALLKN